MGVLSELETRAASGSELSIVRFTFFILINYRCHLISWPVAGGAGGDFTVKEDEIKEIRSIFLVILLDLCFQASVPRVHTYISSVLRKLSSSQRDSGH